MSLNLLKSNWLFYQSNLYGLAIDQKGSAMTVHVLKCWNHQLKSLLHNKKLKPWEEMIFRVGKQKRGEVFQDVQVQNKGIMEYINFKYTAFCLKT